MHGTSSTCIDVLRHVTCTMMLIEHICVIFISQAINRFSGTHGDTHLQQYVFLFLLACNESISNDQLDASPDVAFFSTQGQLSE